MKLKNPYNISETIDLLKNRYIPKNPTAKELFDKAIALYEAKADTEFIKRFEHALLYGSTVELRDVMSLFGDYWAPPQAKFPYYPHSDAVNSFDTAMHHLKCEAHGIEVYDDK